AKNVSNLRKVLGGEESAQYIETIPRRGYRFVASVKDVCDERARAVMLTHTDFSHTNGEERDSDQDDSDSVVKLPKGRTGAEQSIPLLKPQASLLRWLVILLALGLIFGAAGWVIVSRSSHESPARLLNIVPFTSFPGRETHAAFSPDRNQIAFAWDGGKGGNPDIYVKLIGAGRPLPLTSDLASDTHPAWSPDGRQIAFFRQTTESSGFYLIPALGGSERKICDVFHYQTPFGGNSQYYSPDGKFLAVVDKNSQEEPYSIYLV